MIQLIADSGSTNTDWAVVSNESTRYIKTSGINPIHQDDATIEHLILQELCPQLNGLMPTHIHFYGAGCVGGAINERVIQLLSKCFQGAHIAVESDLLGAARSLCGNSEGIAGILGTGSNSCQYNGREIVANTPPLGYILGDEGSGASLGKAFLRALLRNELGDTIRNDFYATYQTNYSTLIGRIYREPAANRYLASLSPYIASHLDNTSIYKIVYDTFTQYIDNHITHYDYHRLPLHLTGSVAYHYRNIIADVALSRGVTLGNITPTPIDGLITYHSTSI